MSQWKIKVGRERETTAEWNERVIDIFAIKDEDAVLPCEYEDLRRYPFPNTEDRRCVVYRLKAQANGDEIERAAREAIIAISRLNAGLTSTKPTIREKLLDVIETVKGEASE